MVGGELISVVVVATAGLFCETEIMAAASVRESATGVRPCPLTAGDGDHAARDPHSTSVRVAKLRLQTMAMQASNSDRNKISLARTN